MVVGLEYSVPTCPDEMEELAAEVQQIDEKAFAQVAQG